MPRRTVEPETSHKIVSKPLQRRISIPFQQEFQSEKVQVLERAMLWTKHKTCPSFDYDKAQMLLLPGNLFISILCSVRISELVLYS